MKELKKHFPYPDLSEDDATFVRMLWGSNRLTVGELARIESVLWFKKEMTSGKFSINFDELEKFADEFMQSVIDLAASFNASRERNQHDVPSI